MGRRAGEAVLRSERGSRRTGRTDSSLAAWSLVSHWLPRLTSAAAANSGLVISFKQQTQLGRELGLIGLASAGTVWADSNKWTTPRAASFTSQENEQICVLSHHVADRKFSFVSKATTYCAVSFSIPLLLFLHARRHRYVPFSTCDCNEQSP